MTARRITYMEVSCADGREISKTHKSTLRFTTCIGFLGLDLLTLSMPCRRLTGMREVPGIFAAVQ